MRTLGVDLGARRIGLAVSDASGALARPLEILHVTGAGQAAAVADVIERLAAEEDGLGAVVIGLPRRLDGTPNAQTPIVTAFAEALGRLVRQPIALQDERLTSVEAESRLAIRDRDWRSRKKKLDAAAAAIILQDYLDERSQSPTCAAPASSSSSCSSRPAPRGGSSTSVSTSPTRDTKDPSSSSS